MKEFNIWPPRYNPPLNEQELFRRLFETHRDKVYSYALRLTHVKILAEDIVQDIFMKLWLNRHQLSFIDNKEAWIFRITRNHCFNVLKKIALENRTNTSLEESKLDAALDAEKTVS